MRKTWSLLMLVVFCLLCRLSLKAQNFEKPTSIILIMANGMGMSQITAALIANNDTLNLERFNYQGFIKNYNEVNFAIDPKYGTLPIAGGRTISDELQTDSLKKPWKTLLECAKEKGKSTGIITTGELVSNSITPFYSHDPYSPNDDKIMKDLIYAGMDVFIGGGRRYFKSLTGPDYLSALDSKGYKIIEDYKGLKKSSSKKVAAILDRDIIKKFDKRENYYELAWLRAFKTLVRNNKGYLLVIENPHIEWAAHDNDWRYLSSEIIDYDKLIGMILNYVSPDNKTLVLVVCPYETGGLTINDGNLLYKHLNPKWTTKYPTACLVPVFANGPSAELFTGIYTNTQIYKKIKSLLE